MGKIVKTVTLAFMAALLCCMTVISGAAESQAAGETYSVPLEEAYGVIFHSIHDNKPAGSPLETQIADGVDTATGHLMLSRTDISLEGMGGMDFLLNRYYDSNGADLGHTTVECVEELKVDTIKVHYTGMDGEEKYLVVNSGIWNNNKDGLKDMLVKYTKGEVHEQTVNHNTQRARTVNKRGHDVYGIASGWSFDFPWIETVTMSGDAGWGKKPAYLHYGSAGVIKIATEKDDASKSYGIKGFYGYGYDDIKIEDYDGTTDGIKCRYLMRDKTGLRTYFNEDGVIVLQKDSHDNTIKYTYRDGIYFDRITDSVGREIVFNYSGNGDEMALASVTVAGSKAAGSKAAGNDAAGSDSSGSETAGGVPSKTVIYETERKTYTPHYGDRVSGVILTGATVDGSIEKYSYRTAEHLVNSAGAGVASQRATTNRCYLLNKIESDGSEKHYEYRACSIRGTKDEAAKLGSNVATEYFYVTREYEKDTASGTKSGGIKYDYFQKHDDGLISFADFSEMKNEAWPFGSNGLTAVTVVSSFNPNTYKTNGKYYDYAYTKSDINPDTLKLAKDTDKDVSLYIYNKNKMLIEEVVYGEEKEETLYEYDKNGEGSLVVLETGRAFGSKGSGAVTTKHGYKYDNYRNVLEDIKPQAYKAANADKWHLFTTTYAYLRTDKGYPAGDAPFVCPLVAEETYISADTKSRMLSIVAENGIDYKSICEQRSVSRGYVKGNTGFAGGATDFYRTGVFGYGSMAAGLDEDGYKTISKTDFIYDSHGNEIQGKVYPSYWTDGEGEAIENNYTYNSLGQQTKKTVTLTSAKNPSDNRTYTEEEVIYDSFGNELSYTDENGLTTKTSYNPETGDEEETVNAVGTEYETKNREYISADGLKSMTVDAYGRVSIDIKDAFGNTVVSKDEAEGTWTESIYEYGDNADGEGTDTSGTGSTARLIEERTYTFAPDEKKFITNENGEKTANFYITGKGKEILSGSRHFYDNLGNEVGNAEFSNGELDATHCSSWSFSKSGTEVTGAGDNAQAVSTNYSRELNPAKYRSVIADSSNGTSVSGTSADEYYDMFNDAVLSEEITKTVTDATGNILSQETTSIRGENKTETSTEYETDDFGRTLKEKTFTKKYQDGSWLPSFETETLYSYDENGNANRTDTKSRKEGESEWQTQSVKSDYDEQGHVVREYTPKGVEENTATRYKYDILGRMIQSEKPLGKKDGNTEYQTTKTKYDNAGNVTEKEEQTDGDMYTKTGYTYDKQGNLVMVKSLIEEGNAGEDSSKSNEGIYQYVQYVYDGLGNKVRQFTGMTGPLDIEVAEVTDGSLGPSAGGKSADLGKSGSTGSGESSDSGKSGSAGSGESSDSGKSGSAGSGNMSDESGKAGSTEREKKSADIDTFSYAGKTYAITVSGAKKSDIIHETKYEYDGKNRLTAYTDSEGRREAYTYDINGNLIKTTDKNGNILKNTYDYRNRLTKLSAKDKKTGKETVHTYTYNEYGDVAKQDDTSFEYDDASGQVTKETTKLTDNKNVVKTYEYDSAGNKSAFGVKVGDDTKLSLNYGYDGASRLISVTDDKGNEAVSYVYDTDGNLSERKVAGNALTTTYTYDYQNRLTAMKNHIEARNQTVIGEQAKAGNQTKDESRTGSDGVISEYNAEYLANGQKSKETAVVTDKDGRKNTKTATYTYDLLGRIQKETKTGSKDITYTYDSNNNRKEMTVGNKITAYKYNKNDELLRTDTLNTDTEKDTVVIYKNDKNGNQLATVNRYDIPTEHKDTAYVDLDVTLGNNRLNANVVNKYNALNRLIQTLTKNYRVSFTYDAEGLRTSKTVNGNTTIFVWDGEQLVMELSEDGEVQKRYIRGNDLICADKGAGTDKEYYVTDMHGNVVQLTDEKGIVIKTYEYDSFGNELKPDKNDDNPFRYCGEYYDKETEEVYLRTRYYKPSVGRFMTRDDYTGEEDEPLSLHLYVYCYNNPVYYVDYMGNKPVKPQPTPKPAMKPSTNPIPQQGPAPPSVPINAYDDQKNVLRVKLYGQEKSVWCGPACLQMIITYKTDIKVSQSKLHNQCTGNEENTVVSIFQIKRAAKNNNVKSSIKFWPLSWSGVRKQISQKGPIIAKITWKNGKGHFVVIRGYEFSGGKRYLYINDPLPKGKGKRKKIEYDTFKKHAYGKDEEREEGKWSFSICNFRKK